MLKAFVAAVLGFGLNLSSPAVVSAQVVEVAPLGGYRFGNDIFVMMTSGPVDVDGGPVLGATVNVEMGHGIWFEGLFTRQRASMTVPGGLFTPASSWNLVVDQWLAGGRQEYGRGRARPFVSGVAGLTRAAAAGDQEIRFTAGAGGGVRLPIQRHFGLRADGRVFATFLDAAFRGRSCGGGGACIAVNAAVAWQMEFTATAVVAFGSPR